MGLLSQNVFGYILIFFIMIIILIILSIIPSHTIRHTSKWNSIQIERNIKRESRTYMIPLVSAYIYAGIYI